MKLMFLDADDFNYTILNEWKWNRKDDLLLACSTYDLTDIVNEASKL